MKPLQSKDGFRTQSLPGASRGKLASSLYAAALLGLLLFGSTAFAAVATTGASGDVTVEPIEQLSAEELVDLVAPIALYPDDLLAIVLPASTYPLQIVQAARFLQARESDSGLQPDDNWDDSIIALLNYPEIIELLNDDLDWTWQLGEVVLVQEADMIAAVSEFRERARIAGNLESDDRQIVAVDDEGAIEIKPADPGVIYVPYYEPAQVTMYQRYPVYHYYPYAYPVYYYPYASDHHFSTGFFWGVTSAFSIGWHTQRLHLNHYGFSGHPYYQRTYYNAFYYRRPHLWLHRDYARTYDRHSRGHQNQSHHAGNRWQPDHERAGSRPRDHESENWQDDRRHGQPVMERGAERQVAQSRGRRMEHRTSLGPNRRMTITPTNPIPGARNNAIRAQQGTPGNNPRASSGRLNTGKRATVAPNTSNRKVMNRPQPATPRVSPRSGNERRVHNEPSAPRGTSPRNVQPNRVTPPQRVKNNRQAARVPGNIPQARSAPKTRPTPQAKSAPKRPAQAPRRPNKVQAPVMNKPRPSAQPKRQQSAQTPAKQRDGKKGSQQKPPRDRQRRKLN